MDRAWRLLDDGAGEPAFNMAVDETLLERGRLHASRPALRIYAWDPPAVSLGRFQPPSDADVPPALRGFARVARASGGGAILHRDEVTFAVAAPLDLLGGPGAGVEASFFAVNRAIARGLALLGVEVDGDPEQVFSNVSEQVFSNVPEQVFRNSRPALSAAAVAGSGASASAGASAAAPFLCFERRSRTDLTVRGAKLVGSAQRRTGRWALQHGSIPLGLEPEVEAAPRPTTLARAAGRRISYEEAAAAIVRGFEEALGITLERETVSEAARRRAECGAPS